MQLLQALSRRRSKKGLNIVLRNRSMACQQNLQSLVGYKIVRQTLIPCLSGPLELSECVRVIRIPYYHEGKSISAATASLIEICFDQRRTKRFTIPMAPADPFLGIQPSCVTTQGRRMKNMGHAVRRVM